MASPNAKPTWATLQADPAQKERQDKIVKLVHSQMMKFKVYNPHKLETCVEKLTQLFDNILQNPDEQKYRKVRANNATCKRDVLDTTKESEELLLAAGWHSQVEQMERYWIFDAATNSTTWKHLQFSHQQLQSAQSLIQQKVARRDKEIEERKSGPIKEREILLKQLEADKAARKDKFRPIISGPRTLDAASPPKTGEADQSSASSSISPSTGPTAL